MQIRVYYEDTDCGGIVYHANYLKYCERARSALFFERGVSPLGEVGFVVKTMQINFIAPARLGDMLEVKTKLLKLQSASLQLEQEILLQESFTKKKSKVVFKAQITLACLDSKTQRIAKIPQDMRSIFLNL